MLTPQQLADLDALLGITTKTGAGAGKRSSTKSSTKSSVKPVAKPAIISYLEAQVATGLILQVESQICNCCRQEEKRVLGVLVKYRYKGAVVKRPLNELTRVDYSRFIHEAKGTREVEESPARLIIKCTGCSEESLRMWEESGLFA